MKIFSILEEINKIPLYLKYINIKNMRLTLGWKTNRSFCREEEPPRNWLGYAGPLIKCKQWGIIESHNHRRTINPSGGSHSNRTDWSSPFDCQSPKPASNLSKKTEFRSGTVDRSTLRELGLGNYLEACRRYSLITLSLSSAIVSLLSRSLFLELVRSLSLKCKLLSLSLHCIAFCFA